MPSYRLACRLASIAAPLLVACSYNTSDFAVRDGGNDTTIEDSTLDDTTVDETDTTQDDTGIETDDTTIDDTTDAGDSHPGEDADTADTIVFDTASCTEAGAIACGSPPACALTKDDPLHCTSSAGCGIACDPTQYCQNGACACRPGLVACGGSCVDVAGDENHCGGCPGTVCSGANHCADGACTSGATCTGGRLKCNRSCWDVAGDPTHCGTTCTDIKTCNPDQLCIGGACVAYKPAIGCSSVSGCDCTSILGSGARACAALTGSSDGVPICVASTFCPAAPWN